MQTMDSSILDLYRKGITKEVLNAGCKPENIKNIFLR